MIIPFNKHRLFRVLKWSGDGNSGNFDRSKEPADPLVSLEETTDLNTADIVSSEMRSVQGLTGRHMVMFDCDVPITVLPSTHEGRYHVYFPASYVSKDMLMVLLDTLADANIVERGYAEASKARGFAALRLPWVKKRNSAPTLASLMR